MCAFTPLFFSNQKHTQNKLLPYTKQIWKQNFVSIWKHHFLMWNFSWMRKMKKNILSQVSHSFEKNTLFYFILFYWEKISPHFHLGFKRGGRGIFLTIVLHFGEVLQTCPNLILNPSWVACIWCDIKKLEKEKQCLKVLKMKHDSSSTHHIHL